MIAIQASYTIYTYISPTPLI